MTQPVTGVNGDGDTALHLIYLTSDERFIRFDVEIKGQAFGGDRNKPSALLFFVGSRPEKPISRESCFSLP